MLAHCVWDVLGPDALRRRGIFLLLVQKKNTKEKDTPGTLPSRWSAPLRCSPARGRCATRAIRYAATRSDSARYFPGPPALLGSVHGDPERRLNLRILASLKN